MRTGLAEAAVFAAAFAVLAAGAYPWLAPRDAGDLALSALTLFPAHPPGYALYAVAGRAWLALLPLGSAAYRLNLLSALAAAGAAAALFAWTRRRVGAAPAAALCAAFVLSGAVRKFGGLSEMYAAHALFLALLLLLTDGERPSLRRAAAAGLATGLGLVNHPTLLLALPGLALLGRPRLRSAQAFAAFAALGLSLELFLVVRLGSIPEAWRALMRAEYGSFELFSGLAAPLSPSSAWALLAHWALGAAPLALLAAGAFARREARRPAAALWTAAAAAGPGFFLLSRFDASSWVARSVLESAFVGSAVLLTALAALGLAALAPRLRLPAALAAALWSAAAGARDGFHRDDFTAHDYVQSLRRLTPPGATILAGGDTALFGLRYAERERPSRAPRRMRSTLDPAGPADFTLGVPAQTLADAGLGVRPEGLVQRVGAGGLGEKAWELVALRPARALENAESYAHDVRLSYAFAHYVSGDLLERAGESPEDHGERAAALDPEDFSLAR